METTPFLLALAGLAGVTYLMRLLGVRLGARARAGGEGTEASAARIWMDRAVVVLILAVAVTGGLFDGKEIADAGHVLGVGAGMAAGLLRVPMLLCVLLGMVVCALIRLSGFGW
ncbi:AzlD domain-containing protein [Brevibacterium sp.]|uniref:AzlD domain-containing protein n=1 Tax=Brevibacterium sp. TaxID=1701 RepID=UPI0025BE79DE|nr:AzlD domain-containing protein [Brevibacterium sp.]